MFEIIFARALDAIIQSGLDCQAFVYADGACVLVKSRREGMRLKQLLQASFAGARAGRLSPRYMQVRDLTKPITFLGFRFRLAPEGGLKIWVSKGKLAAARRNIRQQAKKDIANGLPDLSTARQALESWTSQHEQAFNALVFWDEMDEELMLMS